MRTRIVLTAAVLGVGALVASPAFPQTSANFNLQEHVLNAGGTPTGGSVLTSPSFRIRLDSIGDSITGSALSSTSWQTRCVPLSNSAG